MQLDKCEKTLTLAIKLRQGLALAKLLEIMNLEQKTVRNWPVCQHHIPMRATCIKGRQSCCYGKSMGQLFHAVRGLQQRWWQPMSIIEMLDRQ